MKWPKLKMSPTLRENLLTILMVCGVVAGVIVGLILRKVANDNGNPWTQREVSYVNFLGELFLNMLKALILPLIASSLVAAVGSLDLSLSGKIGSRAVAYYLTTTVMAVILGIILVVTIQPGSRHSGSAEVESSISRNVTTTDTLMDLVRHMFPPNLVQACIQQYQTVLKPPSGNVTEPDLYKWKMTGSFENGTNILGVVVASIVMGIALSTLQRETGNLLRVIREFNTMIMKVTGWVIWLSPIGVLFLVASKVLEIKDFSTIIGQLGLYFVTVAGGITFHGFVILPMIYFVMTRKNPYKFVARMAQAIATAFGTSSSSATLPVTIQCVEEKMLIDPRVTRFVLPIGATINMDGTALYEAVAAIFIAQVRGIYLSFGSIVAVCITATAAAIGAAGIPQAGLVTLVMVLDTVGLPAEDVSLIIAVDWLLDRFRTVVNVLGDGFGAAIVSHLSQKELKSIEIDDASTTNSNSYINNKSQVTISEHL